MSENYCDIHRGVSSFTATGYQKQDLINLFAPGHQNRRLMEHLTCRPIYNHEIRDLGILNHTGRISEIRRVIRPHGWDVIGERIHGGAWEYRLVRVETKPVKPPAIVGFFNHIMGFFKPKGVKA